MARLVRCTDCRKKVSINAVSCPNCGAPVVIPDKPQKSNSIVKVIIGLIVIAVLVSMCSSDPEESTEKQGISDNKKETVDYSTLVYKIDEEGYPEIYKQWGTEWVDKINSSMLPALQTVSQHKECGEPKYIGLSEAYSEVKEKAVYFVDCNDDKRFYIPLEGATNLDEVKTDKDIAKEREEAESTRLVSCQMLVKNSLKNPKSFDTEYSSIVHKVDPETGNDIVGFKFYAQNAFGAEIINQAACIFNKEGKLVDYGIQ